MMAPLLPSVPNSGGFFIPGAVPGNEQQQQSFNNSEVSISYSVN